MRQQRIACLVILALCGLASAQVDQTVKKLKGAKISDLTFMSGHWRGELEGEVTDEHWAEPLGDSLMGVFRCAKSGKVTFYELMAIEQEEKGPVFKLKHFNRGLVGWEEKAEVWSYPLVELRDDYAAFDAHKKFGLDPHTVSEPAECAAGAVLRGRKRPNECPSFGVSCTPEHPLGALMVSSEGACAAYYRYRRPMPPPQRTP